MKTRACAEAIFRLAMFLLVALSQVPLNAREVKIKKVASVMPAADLTVIGSGSGVIVGRGLVLTNRHVAEDDGGSPRAGFRILTNPDYKVGHAARVIWICEDYDLALLETSNDVACKELICIQDLPPLGTKVTAYGFPHGDEFGIGLTVTGGQITRHPVETSDTDTGDTDIKRSVWHDAVTAGGSSGGPLFAESGVLLGLHFGSLRATKGHALSVPATALTSFLRSANIAHNVKFIAGDVFSSTKTNYEPTKLTVYIQVLADSKSRPNSSGAKLAVAKYRGAITTAVAAALPRLTDADVRDLENGEFKPIFPKTSAINMKAGELMRISGSMTLIQVLNDGILVKIDGVLCQITLAEGRAAELRAKIGSEIISGLSIDEVFIIGPATDYTTVRGTTNSYYPLVSASALTGDAGVKELIVKERARRVVLRQEEEKAQHARVEAKAIADKAEAKKKLLHSFKDASGGHSVEAVLVKVDGRNQVVELLRATDHKLIKIAIDKLSVSDRRWVAHNAALVKSFGEAISEELKAVKEVERK